jgi:hypothetical protein
MQELTQQVMVEPLPSVSVICPCKNERGSIGEATARTPVMGPATELVFVDGNSTDGTLPSGDREPPRRPPARASGALRPAMRA